jgi:hypothetical protein
MTFNENVNKAYIQTQFEISEQIENLQDKLADHNSRAININWTHVGDLKYILSQLKRRNRIMITYLPF